MNNTKRGIQSLAVLLIMLLLMSAGLLRSAYAAGPQLEVTSEPKSGESFTGLSGMARDGDVYIYNWRTDGTRTWDLLIPAEAFTHGTLTLTVDLPVNGGMVFKSNTLANLRAQALVSNAVLANYISNVPYRLVVTFNEVTDPSAALDFLLAINTDASQNVSAKAMDAIENGRWPDAEMKFSLSSSDGEVASAVSYAMRLENGEEKEITGTGRSLTSYSTMAPLNHVLKAHGNRDQSTLVVPTYGYEGTELMIIDEIRVYIPQPSEHIFCRSLEVEGGTIIGYIARADGTRLACDGQRYSNATGEYYILRPSTSSGSYANIYSLNNSITIDLTKYWAVSADLEPDTVYAAPDTEIIYRTVSGEHTVAVPGTGFTLKTYPKETVDTWRAVARADFRKLSGNRYTSEQARGSSSVANFAAIWNYSSLINDVEQVAAVSGRTTESYTFPKEIRPDVFTAYTGPAYGYEINGAWGFGIESVTITIAGESGSERTVVKRPDFDSKTADEAIYELDFTRELAAGERVSSFTTVYSYIQGMGYTSNQANVFSRLSYSIAGDAELGPVHIGYSVSCDENGKSLVYNENSQYFWIKIIEPACPDLVVANATINANVHSLDDTDIQSGGSYKSMADVILRGISGGVTKVTDPRIELDITLARASGFENAPSDPTIFLSGGMTLSMAMAGFTVEYSYSDGTDTYDRTFNIPADLEEDYRLTRELLGLGKGDVLLSFVLKKDGEFDFSEARSGETNDYRIISGISPYYTSTDENGELLITKPVTNAANLPALGLKCSFYHSADDHCDKESTHSSGTGDSASSGNYTRIMSAKCFSLNTVITGTQRTPVTSQGGTMDAEINFAFSHGSYTGPDIANDIWGTFVDMGTTENIYIELADSQFELVPTTRNFITYLDTHGMDPDEVRIIELAEGRRFLHLSTGDGLFYQPKIRYINSNSQIISNYKLTLTLRAWGGAAEGVHNPFGDVYFDLGDMARYDGTPENDNQHITMQNTVTDAVTAELTSDAERMLWKGDLSALEVRITRATEVGSSMVVAVSGILVNDDTITFRENKADDLTVSTTMTSPQGVPEVTDYTWIEKLPRKADGDEFDVFITGPAYTHNNSLDPTSRVSYGYSVNGTNFVTEAHVDDWSRIRYVRTIVDKTSEITSLETRYPVRAEKDSFGPPKTVRITGSYSYEISGSVQQGTMAPMTLIYEDSKYTIENYYQNEGAYPQTPTETVDGYGTAGETVTLSPLEAPDLDPGYAFDATQDNVVSGMVADTDDLVLKFYYKQQFKVSYLHGHDAAQDQVYDKLDWGAAFPMYSGEPSREGWYFLGWNTEPDGSGCTPEEYASGQSAQGGQGAAHGVTEDVTFHARWTPNSSVVVPVAAAYRVEHYKQQTDGSFDLYDTEFPLVGELGSTVDAEIRDLAAEHFLAEPDARLSVLSGTVVMPTVSVGSNGQPALDTLTLKVYYLLDGHSLSYDANDAAYPGAPTAEGSMQGVAGRHGSIAEVADACSFTREGWVFDGWNTEPDGSGDAPAAGDELTLDEDIVLYARWIPESSVITPMAAAYRTEHWLQQPDGSYELADTEFSLVGELGSTADAEVRDYTGDHYLAGPNAELSVLSGTVVLPSPGNDPNAGPEILTLKVFYDLEERSLSYIANDKSYPDAPAAEGSMPSETKLHGNSFTVADDCGFTREGWVFTGWNTRADGSGDDMEAGDVFTPEEDAVLYARWIPESSVISPAAAVYRTEHWLQQPDGSYELDDTEFPLIGQLGATVNARVRDYTDEHYLAEPNPELSVLSGMVVMPSAGNDPNAEPEILTLKVCYDLEEHSFSYDANDASYSGAPAAEGSMPSVSARHGEEVVVSDNGYTRSGWVFDGWSEDSAGSVPARASSGAFVLTEDVTFYAQWIPRSSPVTPKAAAYKVEHWRQNADGKYELYETEFPLYGEIGARVSAAAKDYTAEGYLAEPNAQHSVASGRVSEPELVVSNGIEELRILTLKLYYDLKPEDPKPQPAPKPEKLETDRHYAYILGYPDGSVRPEANITRAEISQIFYRLLKDSVRARLADAECDYSDVSEGDWFYEAVAAMSELGIVGGYPDGSFRPSEYITRAEIAAMAVRFDETANSSVRSFSDVIGHWAQSDITKAAENGWVRGYEDGSFRPDHPITRAESMAMINRVLGRDPENEDDLRKGMIVATDNHDRSKWYWIDVQEAMNSHEYTERSGGHEKWTKLIK